MNDDLNSKNITIESQQIMEIIPHRYPFLLIDRVIHLVKDKSAIGIKIVLFPASAVAASGAAAALMRFSEAALVSNCR